MAYYINDIGAVGIREDETLIRRYGITDFVDSSGSPVGYTDDNGDVVIPRTPWMDEDSDYVASQVVTSVNDAHGQITITSAEREIEVVDSSSGRTIWVEWFESSSDCPPDPVGGPGVKAE